MATLIMDDAKKCRSCGVQLPRGNTRARCDRCLISEQLIFSHTSPSASCPEQIPAQPAHPPETDFGNYVLLDEIARGGMGCVYRARQKSLDRIVALKRPLPGVAADPQRVRRFRTEAEAVAALSHPNIIPVFESGEFDGEQFFSMAYVEGESLTELLRQRSISPVQAARYVEKIARAIHHAHQRGVLHRDLKPANILIDASDEPRIADFGIAQLLRGPDTEGMDAVAGTANYMAPEQVQPGLRQLSVATDVYALGGILYHLLTQRPPFAGRTRDEVFWAVYYEEPAPPAELHPGLSRNLEAICLKALEKAPEARYASAQAMADDLQRFLQGQPVEARPITLMEKSWLWVRRNPVTAALSLLLMGAISAGLIAQFVALHKLGSARAASEGFIGFMNQDLARDLRDVGRLDLMEKVSAKADDYYTNHTALGDRGYWERKAQFYENTAAIEKDLGELSRAESRAVTAEAIYEQQQRREPGEPRWRRNQSRVRLLRLNIAKDAGRRPTANAHGDVAVNFAVAAVGLDRSDTTNQANLANVLLEQASFWIEQKRTEGPTANITRAETILREVSQSRTADPEWSLWLANCAYYRGLVKRLRADFNGALAKFNDYLDLMRALVGRFPQNTRWQFELTVAYSRVGEALISLNQFGPAQSYIDIFEASARNLAQLDTRNAAWLSLYGQSLAWKGYLAKGRNPTDTTVRDYFRAALVIQSNLVFRNPSWDRWLDAAARTTSELARWHEGQGEKEQALSIAAQWRQECQERATNNPANSGHQRRWGNAIVAEAELTGRIQGRDRLIPLLLSALAQFDAVPPGQPETLAKARVLSKLADCYDTNGDARSAASHLAQALVLRLAFLERSPDESKVREQISDNFKYAVLYDLKSGDVTQACVVAEEALAWASKCNVAEEVRADYVQMCGQLTESGSGRDEATTERIKRIVAQCLAERLQPVPELSTDQEAQSKRLRDWLDQHP